MINNNNIQQEQKDLLNIFQYYLKTLSGESSEKGMVEGLIKHYNEELIPHYSNNFDKSDTLVNFIFSSKETTLNKLSMSFEDFISRQTKHYGNFSSDFGLTESQRYSLIATISPELKVVPVNGPPGTGKTALLRSIFANNLVENTQKAYKDYKISGNRLINTGKPILGSSSVNQAILNIIEGISGGLTDAKDAGYNRWLTVPNLHFFNKDGNKTSLNIINRNIFNVKLSNLGQGDFTNSGTLDISLQEIFMFIERMYRDTKILNKIENFYLEKSGYSSLEIAIEDLQQKILRNNQVIKNIVQEELKKFRNKSKNIQGLKKMTKLSYAEVISKLKTLEIDNPIIKTVNGQYKKLMNGLKTIPQFDNKFIDELNYKINDFNFIIAKEYEISKFSALINKITGEEKRLIESKSELVSYFNSLPKFKIKIVSYPKLSSFFEDYNSYITELNLYIKNIQEEVNSNHMVRITLEKFIFNQDKYNELKNNKEKHLLLTLSKHIDLSGLDGMIELEHNTLSRLSQLDTKERFETFFHSLHMLEAFFIINLKRLNANIHKCPVCGGKLLFKSGVRTYNGETKYVKSPIFQCENQKTEKKGEKYIESGSCSFKYFKRSDDPFKYNWSESDISNNKKIASELFRFKWKSSPDNEKTGGFSIFKTKDNNYILNIQSFDINKPFDKNNNKYFSSLYSLDNLSLITPLFPMITTTMHSMYSRFKHGKEFFDIILTDESGMIQPAISIPTIYSAKKIVIVGDEMQIEPVVTLSKEDDDKLLLGVPSELHSRVSILQTNFIKMANDSTKIQLPNMKDYEENNLWLKEHFRCKDEIIDLCNEIVYKGILVPKVRTYSKKLYLDSTSFKSMSLFHTESKVVKNSSELEAKGIINHIVNNLDQLVKEYNIHNKNQITKDQFFSKIGIVTPFRNQVKLIKKLLPMNNNLFKITVGTVHAFQGSEREIIYLSPVVDSSMDENSRRHFINSDNGNMMNVSISRAKAAFWTFGDKNSMKKIGGYTKSLVEYYEK